MSQILYSEWLLVPELPIWLDSLRFRVKPQYYSMDFAGLLCSAVHGFVSGFFAQVLAAGVSVVGVGMPEHCCLYWCCSVRVHAPK